MAPDRFAIRLPPAAVLAALLVLAAVACARAQAWPQRPPKLLVPFAAGGNIDIMGRIAAQRLTDAFGLSLPFDVEPFRRHCLLNGLDDIGLTLEHEDKIASYERAHGIAS